MCGLELFKEFSDKKVKQREEGRNLSTANTDGWACRRPTPDEIGKEIINQMKNDINFYKE